jgi:hypothetical protein
VGGGVCRSQVVGEVSGSGGGRWVAGQGWGKEGEKMRAWAKDVLFVFSPGKAGYSASF